MSAAKIRKTDFDDPQLYINRELSWLEFNDRVLREGLDEQVAPMDRLKFLAIVSSNLDEFFMIRVAGLQQQEASGVTAPDASGLAPAETLRAIDARVRRMMKDHAEGVRRVKELLAKGGLRLPEYSELADAQKRFLRAYFMAEVLGTLTPIAIDAPHEAPLLPDLKLNLALMVAPAGEGELSPRLAVVPVPNVLPRFITIPGESGLSLARLEDVVSAGVSELFPGYRVLSTALFRITRDADVSIDADEAGDLMQQVEEAVRARRRRAVVRLEVSAGADEDILGRLREWFELDVDDVYEIDGMLDASALMDVAMRPGFDSMKEESWTPQTPADLVGKENLFETLQNQDVLLFHPYESFDPVVQLVQAAAEDPNVLAVKQTLYRTSGDSPIIAALARAAERGKQVTVLVELKARFDESRNAGWARRLEDVGCHVIYGIAGYKTHAKALLIVRREAHLVRRYLHLSTGNYNDRTARLYSDLGLMTSDRDMCSDAAAFFNLLTGYSQQVGWSKFVVSPLGLRKRFVELIDREIRSSTKDFPGLIQAKMNSLQDPQIIQALYRASQAGVRVMLNVRGLCCLRPGVEGVSDNIEVTSIVDRYLEHARIFYFRNGGHEEMYLASADWMERNLDRRLEILFPVLQKNQMRRLLGVLSTYFADTAKSRRLLSDGAYERPEVKGTRVRAQESFYRQAVEAAQAEKHGVPEFRPLTSPQNGE
jgi:polyphosphate kinase